VYKYIYKGYTVRIIFRSTNRAADAPPAYADATSGMFTTTATTTTTPATTPASRATPKPISMLFPYKLLKMWPIANNCIQQTGQPTPSLRTLMLLQLRIVFLFYLEPNTLVIKHTKLKVIKLKSNIQNIFYPTNWIADAPPAYADAASGKLLNLIYTRPKHTHPQTHKINGYKVKIYQLSILDPTNRTAYTVNPLLLLLLRLLPLLLLRLLSLLLPLRSQYRMIRIMYTYIYIYIYIYV